MICTLQKLFTNILTNLFQHCGDSGQHSLCLFYTITLLYFILTGFKSEQLPNKTHLTVVYGFMCQSFTTNFVVGLHTVFVRRSCQYNGGDVAMEEQREICKIVRRAENNMFMTKSIIKKSSNSISFFLKQPREYVCHISKRILYNVKL